MKRLIEHGFPLAQVSAIARKERYQRKGALSALHIWWARKPLSSTRAVLLATLLPDPEDPECPESFRDAAREILRSLGYRTDQGTGGLRSALLQLVEAAAHPRGAGAATLLGAARKLVRAAWPEAMPLVADPFGGGGSIPLEALRLGAHVWAGDLNPVSVLQLRTLLEDFPRSGSEIAEVFERWVPRIEENLRAELGRLYPASVDGTPLAYFLCHTARCEGPACGAQIPLVSKWWLARKGRRRIAIVPVVRPGQNRGEKDLDFEIASGAAPSQLPSPTVLRGSARCLVCGASLPVARVREQSRVSGLPLRLLAVLVEGPGGSGRGYRLPGVAEIRAFQEAAEEVAKLRASRSGDLADLPDEPLPPPGALGFRVQRYGYPDWGSLFTPRQAIYLTTLGRLVRESAAEIRHETSDERVARGVTTLLGFLLARAADYNSAFCRWLPTGESASNTFSRMAFPMVWDPVELNPLAHPSSSLKAVAARMAGVAREVGRTEAEAGTATLASATRSPLPDASVQVVMTDPPYYDAIPYSDLSDYFYVWLKRSVKDAHPDLFRTRITPKDDEVVVNPGWKKTREVFEEKMTAALREARRITAPDGVAIIVFAHKSTSGWEALLSSVLAAGWTVSASWPIDTEMESRLRALGSATLGSSVHLVCRPRPAGEQVGDWREVLGKLQPRVHQWLPRLAASRVVGADAIFACLGPALEVFSRYSSVEKASGEKVTLKEYLEHVWAAVSNEALQVIFEDAETAGFEEDARLTVLWLWTLSSGRLGGREEREEAASASEDLEEETKEAPRVKARPRGFVLEYDTARKIAQGLGAHLEDLKSVVEVSGETCRLLPVSERSRHLLGKAVPKARGRTPAVRQLALFESPASEEEGEVEGAGDLDRPGSTVLDRIHQSMLLFASGRGEALRRFVTTDGVGRDGRYWQLAHSLSALYPPGSEEKRWIEGILARKKGFGF